MLLLAANSFVNGFNYYAVEGAKMIYSTVLVTLAAFVFWYVVHNIVHELFHALAAKIFYGKIISIAVCGLEFCFVKGRKKVVKRPISAYAGATEFVSTKPEKAYLTLYASLLGGLVGTGLTMIVIALLHRLTSGFFSHYFIMMGFFPVAYMFLVNFVLGGADSDGHMLFLGKKGYKTFVKAAMRLEEDSYLYMGNDLLSSAPVKMTELFGEEKTPDEYDYLRALQIGDIALAKEIANELINEAKNGDNGVIDGLIDPVCEKFFIDLLCGEQKSDEETSDAKETVLFYDDINSLRIHCVYRYATGETDWADKLKESYFKLCETIWVEGLKKTYIEIGNRWLKSPAEL